mmetsp:Transcript_155108/g.495959  ORF Transcript_155108/g.495959 Transcript_155108/m.495959 type:complete len:219 (+) Transcript_155108:360-1016(+)
MECRSCATASTSRRARCAQDGATAGASWTRGRASLPTGSQRCEPWGSRTMAARCRRNPCRMRPPACACSLPPTRTITCRLAGTTTRTHSRTSSCLQATSRVHSSRSGTRRRSTTARSCTQWNCVAPGRRRLLVHPRATRRRCLRGAATGSSLQTQSPCTSRCRVCDRHCLMEATPLEGGLRHLPPLTESSTWQSLETLLRLCGPCAAQSSIHSADMAL